jgi:hypothetical protein
MGSSKLLWLLPLNFYIGLPKGNGVDWEEPLIIDDKKSSRHDSKSNCSNSQPNYENNNENDNAEANHNQNANNGDKIMGDSGSMNSLYKSSHEVIFTYLCIY